MKKKTKYLSVSLLHPKIVKGGGQQVAYETFEGAKNDSEFEAFFLAGIDPFLPNAHVPPGAVFTGIDNAKNESILISYNFDTALHRQTNWFVIEKVNEYFSLNKFDVIHFHHSLFVGLDLVEIAKSKQPNAQIIYTLHEYLPMCLADGQLKKKHSKALCYDSKPSQCYKCFPELSVDYFYLREATFKKAFSLVDHFITPSEFTRGRFIEWGIKPEKISTIANGQKNINRDKPTSLMKSDKKRKIRFAFFGQMIDNKGSHVILEAANNLFKQDEDIVKKCEFHFYGGNMEFASKEYKERLKNILDDMDEDLRKTIFFHGEYDHNQLPQIFKSVDCVITPSTWFEVFGLVVSEAWMFGKPVIASDIGGLSERIIDGQNGLKFTANDPIDLSRCIDSYINEYFLAGIGFPNIKPPMSQEEFWEAHKKIFLKVENEKSKNESASVHTI